MKSYFFEKLDVWQIAKDLSVMLCKVTQNFPDAEKFGLISQIRRAATSIAANIAEGTGRPTGKEKNGGLSTWPIVRRLRF